MNPRTTLWQCLRLAWAIYRHPARHHLRIGQLLVNVVGGDPFYVENEVLIGYVRVDGRRP